MAVEEIKIFCDGGSRGNPGPAASGVVIISTNGDVLSEYCEYLGIQTNNYAEYSSVLLALRKIAPYKNHKIIFYLDSQLVVRQLNGDYKVKNDNIRSLYQQVIDQIKGLDISFHHVYRESNKLADAQVNKCLDNHLLDKNT